MSHRSKSPLLSFILGVFVTLFAAFPLSAAQVDPQLDTTLPTISRMAGSNAESRKATYQSNLYIVRLENDAVASYMGGVPGMAATSNRATGATKLDTNSPASRTYASFLVGKQDAFIAHCEAAFGHAINVPYKYLNVVNGVAMELSPEEAAAISSLPEVAFANANQDLPDPAAPIRWPLSGPISTWMALRPMTLAVVSGTSQLPAVVHL